MLAANLTFILVFHGELQSSLHCSFIGMELDLPRYALTKWIAFPLNFCAGDKMVYFSAELLIREFCGRKVRSDSIIQCHTFFISQSYAK